MTIKELVKELEILVEQGLGNMLVTLRHDGDLPPLQENEVTRTIVGAGHLIIE